MHDPLQQQHQPQGGQPPGFDPRMAQGQQYGVAPLVPEPDGWGKIGIVMVALAVVFAGGVAYFIATSGGSENEAEPTVAKATVAASGDAGATEGASTADPTSTDPTSTDPTSTDRTSTDPTVAASDAGAAATTAEPTVESDAGTESPGQDLSGTVGLLRANGEIDRPAGLVSLALESTPSGAAVIRKRDGVRLGTTPYRYETETSAGNVSFILKLDGYRSMSVTMPGNKDAVRQVMLLPGKGGVPIPDPAEPAGNATETSEQQTPTAKPEPQPKTAAKVKKPPKPKRPSKPSKPAKPKKPKKPKKSNSGKVDYNPGSIPL